MFVAEERVRGGRRVWKGWVMVVMKFGVGVRSEILMAMLPLFFLPPPLLAGLGVSGAKWLSKTPNDTVRVAIFCVFLLFDIEIY